MAIDSQTHAGNAPSNPQPRLPADRADQHEADAGWLPARSLVLLLLALMAVGLLSLEHWQLPAGYLGFEIILVVAGFLCQLYFQRTSPGTGARQAKQALDAWQFLANRYLLLVIVLLPLAIWMLLPQELIRLYRDIIASILLISNLTTWQDRSFLDGLVATTPLAHTWLVSLIAQFFLLTLVVHRMPRSWTLPLMLIGTLISLMAGLWAFGAKPSLAFYFPVTRFWPFGLGIITAMATSKLSVSGIVNTACTACGTALVVYALLQPGPYNQHGMGLPVIAVTGACLVLLPGKGARLQNRVALSGLATLYLMHHPLIAILKTLGVRSDIVLLLALGALAFAIVSVHAIAVTRQRFCARRRNNRAGARRAGALIWGSLLLVVWVCWWGIAENGKILRQYPDQMFALETIADSPCYGRSGGNPEIGEACALGGGNLRFALIGDGHAATLFNAMHRHLKDTAVGFRAIAGPYCAPLFDFSNIHYSDPSCAKGTTQALEQVIADPDIELIVMYAQWANYTRGSRDGNPPSRVSYRGITADSPADNPSLFAEALDQALARMVFAGKQVLLVTSTPEFDLRVLDDRSRNWLIGTYFSPPHTATSAYALRNREVLQLFERHARQPRVSVLEAQALFCAEALCEAMDRDGQALFSDNSHLTGTGAEVLAQAILNHASRLALLEEHQAP